jgi:hypothetical protein
MAKADIEIGEPASGAVVSDADVAYTDHISSDVAEIVSDQPELVAMNTVQLISDSAVLAEENVTGGGGIPWMWVGAAAVAGGGLGVALGSNQGGNDAAPAAGTPVDSTVHVVVERDGAYIDTNADDIGEIAVTGFQEGGNAWLADPDHPVVVHFNDLPLEAINLTGFGEDDKIQFDMTALHDNMVLVESSGSLSRYLEINSTPVNRQVVFGISNQEPKTGVDFTLIQHQHPASRTFYDFSENSYTGKHYFLSASYISSVAFGGSGGSNSTAIIAYWDDTGNALNVQSNILPNFTGSNTDRIVGNLNAGTEGGLVEFVNFPEQDHVYVIVNDSANAYIDQDGNGILNSCDYIGGCCSSYESANFASGGNAYLAENAVTIHFHDYTDGTTYFDLSGFTANDRIEVDMDAIFGKDPSILRTSQTTAQTTTSSGSDFRYASTVDIEGKAPYSSASAFVSSPATKILVGQQVAPHGVRTSNTIAHFHNGYSPVSHGNVDFVYSSSPITIDG